MITFTGLVIQDSDVIPESEKGVTSFNEATNKAAAFSEIVFFMGKCIKNRFGETGHQKQIETVLK